VSWVSILKVDFGTTVHAVSTALTIFMGGLALGSWWVGRRIDRGAQPLQTYAALEAGLGVWAALFALAIPAWHALSARLLSGSALSVGQAAPLKLLLAAAVLLPPAALMGGTLPALARAITESAAVRVARLARLYGINTFGAVVGCLLEAFVLVPSSAYRRPSSQRRSTSLAVAPDRPAGSATAGQESAPTSNRASAALFQGACRHDARLSPDRRSPSSPASSLATEVLWTRLAINLLTGNVLIFAALLAGFSRARHERLLWRSARTGAASRRAVALAAGRGLLAASVCRNGLGPLFDAVLRATRPWPAARCWWPLLALLAALPATVFSAVLPLLFRWGSRRSSPLGGDVDGCTLNTLGDRRFAGRGFRDRAARRARRAALLAAGYAHGRRAAARAAARGVAGFCSRAARRLAVPAVRGRLLAQRRLLGWRRPPGRPSWPRIWRARWACSTTGACAASP
jgi:hypothetical protein